MQFLHCPMLSSLAMIEKIERSGERNMEKVFFMKIRNIPSDGPAVPASPLKGVLAHAFSAQLPAVLSLAIAASTAGEDAGRPRHDRDGQGGLLVVERRLEQGQWCLWLNFPAGRPGHWAGLASSSG